MDFITRFPRFFLVLSLIVAAGFGSFAPFVRTVSNVDYFRLKDHPDQKFYEEFKEVFGNDEFFVIAFEHQDIFTPDSLGLIKKITSKLESSELVRDVVSLANVDDIVGEEGYFYISSFLKDIPESEAKLAELKKEASDNPLYVNNIISRDGRTAAIVVFVHDRPGDPNYRQELLAATHSILQSQKDDTTYHLAGWTVTNYTLSQFMQKDLVRFIPITYLLVAAVVFLFFRNLRLTVLAMATISACLVSTMGLFRILGMSINNVTTIVPPLVMALSLADVVHIFSHMQHSVLRRFPDKGQALGHVLKRVAVPCFLTTLTTAAGFLSLAVSDLEPIRQFACLAAAGMVFEFFFAFCFLPPLILFFPPEKLYFEDRSPGPLNWFLKFSTVQVGAHARKIVLLGGLLVLAASVAATRIEVETNMIEYFHKNSRIRKSVNFVEERLSGIGVVDVSVRSKQRDGFKEPEHLRRIDALDSYIKELPGVDSTMSYTHFVKDMNESFHNEDPAYYRIPDSRELISQYLLLYDSDDIDEYINRGYDHMRIMARIEEHSSAEQARIISKIRDYVQSMEAPELNVRVTGQAVQSVNIIQALVSGQIQSLVLATGAVALIMCFALASFPLGMLSLVPNCFPLVLNFGIMGLAGIPLNTATALIAAVALGIAVDDTIHFLSQYVRVRKRGGSVSEAVGESIFIKGRAIVLSSSILCIGFGVLVLSSFAPTMYFGALSALIMITAMLGDLFLLPSLLSLHRGRC
ncbi:MAG: MMPL family transporter [Desulfohalobiaceae bacterium]|nr:MMPL family transporter [Desulfohalobiaceae bacterium]